MVDTFNYFHQLISDSNFCLVDRNTIVNPPIMHMTLNWCFTRVLIDAIGFNRCFIISSFNLATLQQLLKNRQNRRYYHFKAEDYKGRSPCYASLHCEDYGHMRTWNIHNAGKTLHIGIELLLQLENKQQIMQNNVGTQHNRMTVFVI